MNPPITIIMTTWAPHDDVGVSRAQSSVMALASWKRHLQYDGRLRLHLADDGSELHHYLQSLAALWPETTKSRQERRGVGASLNAGFRAAFELSPLALYAVDDWALTADLDLTPWARLLLEDESVGMVRLGPPHPDLMGTVMHLGELGWALRLEPHHYAFGHRPALYHRRFLDAYGPFREGVNAFDCEREYAEHFVSTAGPDIVLALPHPWEHVGTAEVGDIVPEGAVA